MAITLVGTGGLMTRLGKLGGCLNNINGLSGTAAPTPSSLWGASGPAITALGTQIDNIEAQFQAADQNLMDQLYAGRENFRQAQGSFKSYLQTLAGNVLVQMANRDTPLAQVNLTSALKLLIQQMTANANTVTASVLAAGAQTAVGSPTGTPSFVVSTKDGTGRVVEYALPETLTFVCAADSYTGGATAGQESLNVLGQSAQGVYGDTGALDWDWPFGSGVTLSPSAVDGSVDNQGGVGNYLVNSDFETFTNANLPDNWVALAGVVGTNILQGATAYTGTKSLKLAGTGGAAASVCQPFKTTSSTGLGAGGTPGTLLPSTQYLFNCWVQVSSTPAAGVLAFDLIDGSNAVINDMQGAANTVTKSLTAVSTSWVIVSGSFRTPATLPTAYKLRVRLSTDIDSGKQVYIDRLALTAAQSFYPGGPQLAAFSGATPLVAGLNPDTWSLALTNTMGAFQKAFQRFFNMTSLGLILPSAGSGSISDTLVA